jgi:chitin disaccharide deacetylase
MTEIAPTLSRPTAAAIGRVPLIVNGDDFGLSASVNRAIIQAHREGVLTSASLMVNERAAGEAVRLAHAHPQLAVGLHLALALGRSALPHAEIPHLVDENGRFSDSPARAGLNYYFSPAARRELRREMRAQFEKFRATGLRFSHVDGHAHLHLHPAVFKILVGLCEEFGVPRVRIVKDDLRANLKLDRRRLFIKLVWGAVFNLLAKHCERRLRGRNFIRPDRVYGLFQTGEMTEDHLLKLVPRLEKVATEIYAHPLAHDAERDALRDNPGGAEELRALVSARVREAIRAAGFELTTYEGLADVLYPGRK